MIYYMSAIFISFRFVSLYFVSFRFVFVSQFSSTQNLGYFVSVTYFDRTENYNVFKFLKCEEHVAIFHYILVPFTLLNWFLNKVALVISSIESRSAY
jgi:hypothetical protein